MNVKLKLNLGYHKTVIFDSVKPICKEYALFETCIIFSLHENCSIHFNSHDFSLTYLLNGSQETWQGSVLQCFLRPDEKQNV